MPYLTLDDGTPVHYRGKKPLTPAERAALIKVVEATLREIEREQQPTFPSPSAGEGRETTPGVCAEHTQHTQHTRKEQMP